jgi:hypothetical protein
MILSARRRLRLFALTIGLLGLSLAVVNWGLQYKMSLYQSNPDAAQAPAKLWTGKTTGPVSLVAVQVQPTPVSWLIFLLLLLCVCVKRISCPAPTSVVPWKRHLLISLRAFFFRPPPTLAYFSCRHCGVNSL